MSLSLASVALILSAAAQAMTQSYQLNIPREQLDAALKDLAQQTGLQIARFSDTSGSGAFAGPVKGDMRVADALKTLLTPNQLTYKVVNDHTIAVMDLATASESTDSSATSSSPAANAKQQERKERRLHLAQAMASKDTTSSTTSQDSLDEITVRAQLRLLKEKDSPSAVTELGEEAITQTGVQGSIATLLRDAPSVYVYQQGIGNNEPVFTIRGIRGLETAQTLDDVPMQDLLNGGAGSFLQSVLGGRFDLNQISGVSVYPGVAYPDKNSFGTIGGTVAYATKRPADNFYVDVTGSVGTFGTYSNVIELNSGDLPGLLGQGVDAPKFLLSHSEMHTEGYIEYTPAHFNDTYFAFDKPYNDAQSKLQATVLYNTASGLFTPEPVPVPFLDKYGMLSNYAPSAEFNREDNNYLTTILKDVTYINDYVTVGATAFYENSNSTLESYANPGEFTPGGVNNAFAVDGADPFIQVPAGFGQQSLYGPGGAFYQNQVYTYNGTAAYPPGSAACPASLAAQWAAAGQVSPCGYNAQINTIHDRTYGAQPRVSFTPPDIAGISNVIHVGGLAAQETQPFYPTYLGGTPNIPQTPANEVEGYDGGVQRRIFQFFVQDKIGFLNNMLHLTPGVTAEGTDSSYHASEVFGGKPSASYLASAYCQAGNPCDTGAYSAKKWDRDYLPFLNLTYDMDDALPAAKGLQFYASYGTSALFAPVTDFSPNIVGSPPSAAIVHLYEGGAKYNTSRWAVLADYYYQKIDRDFGFFPFQTGPDAGLDIYTNGGERTFRGEELSVQYQVIPQVLLFGNMSHVLATNLATSLANVSVQEDMFGVVQKDTPITGVPAWVSTFGVQYRGKSLLKEGDNFDARFTGQYTGHQNTSYELSGYQNVGTLPIVGPYGSYNYYEATAGSATYDPNGGISPFIVFNLHLNYTLPMRQLLLIKYLKFDLNFQNLFNEKYFAYYFKQVSPAACPAFTNGQFGSSKTNPVSQSSYSCTPQFADATPGEPFAVTFSVTARF